MPPLDQFIMFGDSLTQGSYDQSRGFALAAELQAAYIRRMDIINRGFSGYNTDHGMTCIENVIPEPSQANVSFLTIWFGANDCSKDPHWNQWVPIDRFKSNLISIINHSLVKAQSPHIILFTNPPVEETVLLDINKKNGSADEIRRAKDAKEYAEKTKEVGKEYNLPVLDVWTAFMNATGWDGHGALPGSEEAGKNETLADLLHDGLHLSPRGYKIVFDELLKLMQQNWPDQKPYRMPFVHKVSWEKNMGDSFWDTTG